jgi:hypothetical protein
MHLDFDLFSPWPKRRMKKMNISTEELQAAGFRRAGTVFPDAIKVVRAQIDWPVTGFVIYIMVVNHEFKKAGTTGRRNSKDASTPLLVRSVKCSLAGLRTGRLRGGVRGDWTRSNSMRQPRSWQIMRSSCGHRNSLSTRLRSKRRS